MAFKIDQFRVDGKVAVVTGAGGRGNSIGRAYALGLAGAGAAVVVADINEAGAKAVADEINAAGGKAIAVGVDITDPASAAAMAQAAKAAFGGVDILVNNAALMVDLDFAPVMSTSVAEWNRVIGVNLTGALNCAHAIVPMMQARGGGKIVNQVSGGAYPAQGLYGITKIALVGLTTTLATELGPHNINVNAIAPGATQSDAGKALTGADSDFTKRMESRVLLRFRGQPDELVGALMLLCSPAGDWMTGQVLHVDGGWVVRN